MHTGQRPCLDKIDQSCHTVIHCILDSTRVDRKPGFSWNRVYGSKMVKEPGTRSGSGSRFYYIKSENLKNAITCYTTEKFKLYELSTVINLNHHH